MRNVHDFNATQTKKRYLNGSLSQTFTVTRKARRSQRSDSVSTQPLPDGSYGTATNYTAFFAQTTPSPGQCQWREHLWPYAGSWRTYTDIWDGWTDRGTWNHGVDAVSLEPAIPALIVNRARNHAIEKIRNTDLNMAQFLGESRQAAKTVTSILQDISRGLGSLRRFTSPKAYAQEYLRYMFGVRPLLSDIYSICEVVANGLTGPVGVCRVVLNDDTYTLPAWTNLSYDRHCEGMVTRGIEISYTYTVRDPNVFQLWKYGLTNPISLAWELTTLSFVVDWFTGLGNFFAALDTSVAVEILGGYETRFLRNNFEVLEQQHPNPTNRIEVINGSFARTLVQSTAMRRYGLNSVAVPLPYLAMDLNLNRMMSAIALIIARGSRR